MLRDTYQLEDIFGAPQLQGPLPVPRGGALVDFQVDNSEITFYKHDDDDDDRSPPEWDSEEELSDLDPWLADSSEGEKWTDASNARR